MISRLLRFILILSLCFVFFSSLPAQAQPAWPSAGTIVVPPDGKIEVVHAVWLDYDGLADMRNAFQMAVEDVGAIHGFSVQGNEVDAGCDQPSGLAAANTIVANAQNTGVIGPVCSSSTMGALPVLEAAGVVMISPSNTNAGLPAAGPTVFNRVVLPDPFYEPWEDRVVQLASYKAWQQAFIAHYGHAPHVTAKYDYDATILLLTRIDQVSSLDGGGNLVIDRAALASAVRSTQGFAGVTGDVTLNTLGDRVDTQLTWGDHFNSTTQNTRWSWIRQDAANWSLASQPGFLRITLQPGALLGTANNSQNVLVQDAPSGGFDIRTRMVFTPTQNFQMAGLLIYLDDDNFMLFGRAFCGFVGPCVGDGIYFDHEELGATVGSNFAMNTTVPDSNTYLRVVRNGDQYTGYVSPDGNNWTEVGTHTAGFTPAKIGLVTATGDQPTPPIPVDFDFFLFDMEMYYLSLPIIAKP